MPTITYLSTDGSSTTLDVGRGSSVMRAAVSNGIKGIVGECGGQAMCATCHVYVEDHSNPLPAISDDEDEMLECTAATREDSSRLSCQLASDDFDAITVRLPSRQM